VLLAVLLAVPGAVRAASGDLDPAFGTGGKVTTPFGGAGIQDVARAVVVQSDGKVVASGFTANQLNYDFALARYNGNGSLDTTFGTGGKVTTPIGVLHDDALALALQPDGKLVAAGYTFAGPLGSDQFALVRYNADGSLDGTFGTGGKVTTAIAGTAPVALAVVVQPDGKLVAAGRASGERVWNFPFDADFDSDLESKVADVLQCSVDGKGDHILATRFLNRFVPEDVAWAHVDLSSVSRSGGLGHVNTELTGFGVRFTLEALLGQNVLDGLERAK
jgi:uncharacterized delta-60 repeat protein